MQYSVEPNAAVRFVVRHADDDLLVLEKPPGLVTQPGKRHQADSLLNGLFVDHGRALQNLGAARDWGLLHRLDKGTSGLVVVALRPRAYDHLRRQFEERKVKKCYWGIVFGQPKPQRGVIQKPIAEIVGRRKKAVIKQGGKQAITAYRVLASAKDVALVEASPKTGRLHQIRVHMAAIGHPVLGDSLYARNVTLPSTSRLCLHAGILTFTHPATGHRLTVRSPWPKDLVKVMKRFGLEAPGEVDA